MLVVSLWFLFSGCISTGDCGAHLSVRGRVVDTTTQEPLTEVAIGMFAFSDGEQTGGWGPFLGNGRPLILTGTHGDFEMVFSTGVVPCDPPPEFPRPDQVEVVVSLEACARRFLIEINEETVVDLDFPHDVIELREPLLFEPCAE